MNTQPLLDIRWLQRFSNYKKALAQLSKFIDKADLNKLEEQGLIHSFEYTHESERIASGQMALLDEAEQRILLGAPRFRLEQSGVLHALPVLIGNAIGKSKHQLKLVGESVPVSAYDAFASLERYGVLLLKN